MCKDMSGYRKRKMKCEGHLIILIKKKWWLRETREDPFTFTEKTEDSYSHTDSEVGI